MGRFAVDIELANYADMIQARMGQLDKRKVRRTRLKGVVDCGATRLVLPQSVAVELGLPAAGKDGVRYADHRKAIRPMVRDVWLRLLGREAAFDTVLVEPKRTDALIGAIVLETLDFVVDCTAQKLHPRNPDHIVSEIE